MTCTRHAWHTGLLLATLVAWSPELWAGNLEVGPGKRFARIEDASAKAQPGDTILVYPQAGNQPYAKTAVFVRQKKLTFRAVPASGQRFVALSGKGFSYTGVGNVPRAIFQFNQGTDDCILEGFELTGAHNSSHNGAGVRINQANHVTVRNCNIHHNDMGIMSNGDGSANSALDQRIEQCDIHHNGDTGKPGYSHNLYLGGTSVTLSFCDVHHSLTGQNVKSRAHYTRVQYSYIHHSANREFDLVDDKETTRADSNAVLLGNIIVKDPSAKGNRTVIHFGQDGGMDHNGTIYLAFNTIVTPYISPVVELSAPHAKAALQGNIISDGGSRQRGQVLAEARNGARLTSVTGSDNWFTNDFSLGGTSVDTKSNTFTKSLAPGTHFRNPGAGDYHLNPQTAGPTKSKLTVDQVKVPAVPGMPGADSLAVLSWQYKAPISKEKRSEVKDLTRGAYGQ